MAADDASKPPESDENPDRGSPDGDEDLTRHPGRPRPPDEIDPELVSLRKSRVDVGPLLAAAVIVFCGFGLIKLYDDLRFSRQGDQPRTVENLGQVVGRQGYGPDDFVRMRATPDRSFAMLVSPSGTTDGHRVAPVLGTDDTLWLMVGSESWAEEVTYSEVYDGRLRNLDDVPFADALRDYVKERGAVPRSVTGEAVREALKGGAGAVERPSGDRFEVEPSTPLTIAETVQDRAQVRAFLREDRLPDEATWSRVLTAAGILPEGVGPVDKDEESLFYQVPGSVAEVKQKLIGAQLYAARAEPLRRSHETTWGQLQATDGGLAIGGGKIVPWDSVTGVVLQTPRQVPDDAMVLITGEVPGAYWYVLPLYILLALFVALFTWALVRALLPERGSARASKEAESPA